MMLDEPSRGLGFGRREAEARPKLARDPEAWREWVASYYARHAGHVVEVLGVTDAAARSYCDWEATALLSGGARVVEEWEAEVAPRLAALSLCGEERC